MSPQDGNTQQLQSLLDLATGGDDSAYGALVSHASNRLQRLARKMLDNYPHLRRWEQTDDVFQNAALRLHRSLTEVRPENVRSFFGLAATQIRRTLIDLARHHYGPHGQHAKHHTDGKGIAADDSGGALRQTADGSTKPESLEAWAQFHETVENLPDDEREVFELMWYAQLPREELAEMLDISLSTVKRRWRTAQLTLAESMRGQNPLAEES